MIYSLQDEASIRALELQELLIFARIRNEDYSLDKDALKIFLFQRISSAISIRNAYFLEWYLTSYESIFKVSFFQSLNGMKEFSQSFFSKEFFSEGGFEYLINYLTNCRKGEIVHIFANKFFLADRHRNSKKQFAKDIFSFIPQMDTDDVCNFLCGNIYLPALTSCFKIISYQRTEDDVYKILSKMKETFDESKTRFIFDKNLGWRDKQYTFNGILHYIIANLSLSEKSVFCDNTMLFPVFDLLTYLTDIDCQGIRSYYKFRNKKHSASFELLAKKLGKENKLQLILNSSYDENWNFSDLNTVLSIFYDKPTDAPLELIDKLLKRLENAIQHLDNERYNFNGRKIDNILYQYTYLRDTFPEIDRPIKNRRRCSLANISAALKIKSEALQALYEALKLDLKTLVNGKVKFNDVLLDCVIQKYSYSDIIDSSPCKQTVLPLLLKKL